jgi:hypothetical protein
MTTSLDGELFQLELAMKFLDATLDLGAGSLDGCPVACQLNMVVISCWNEDRSLSRRRGARSWLRSPGLVWRNPDLNAIVLLQIVNEAVPRASNERVELGRNASNLGANVGSTLTSNLQDEIPGDGCRVGIALDNDVDCSIIVIVQRRLGFIDLW